jgi:hypothetical protein
MGGVILESIFGKAEPNAWGPLPLSTSFSEGWLEPWVPSPNGSGGAPRQAWINAAHGNMYRVGFFTFSEGFSGKSNAYLGSYTLITPLSRRLELITNIPFVEVNSVSSGQPTISPSRMTLATSPSQSTFGDVSFTPRVLLHETEDFSVTAEVAVLTPTGDSPLAGTTALIPDISFWNNVAGTWVIRGGVSVIIPIQGGGADTLISQFAFGQTLTGHDVPLIGDFTYFLSTVVETGLANGSHNSVTLTPGIRTHLGDSWYFLAGLPTPLTKERVADLGMLLLVAKSW